MPREGYTAQCLDSLSSCGGGLTLPLGTRSLGVAVIHMQAHHHKVLSEIRSLLSKQPVVPGLCIRKPFGRVKNHNSWIVYDGVQLKVETSWWQ